MLDRYELLYEAGLIEEARRDGREAALTRRHFPALGEPMRFDHRRILATAIARLRAKLKYRPVVFELMAREFTLTELQRTVEAISGRRLHKQNFRRLVETAALVEPTGDMSTATGGRPAALFRFRREVLAERPAAGCGSADGERNGPSAALFLAIASRLTDTPGGGLWTAFSFWSGACCWHSRSSPLSRSSRLWDWAQSREPGAASRRH